MKGLGVVLAGLFVLATSGCAPQVDVEADKAAIRSVVNDNVAAENLGVVSGLLATATDDVVSLPPNEAPLVGKDANRAYWQDFFSRFNIQGTATTEEIEVVGDRAFVRGIWTYSLTSQGGGEAQQETSSYMLIMQRQPDGSWKWARAIWNSDQPASIATSSQPGTGKAVPRHRFAVQLGAFEKRGVAEALGQELSSHYQRTMLVTPVTVRGRTVYRVRILVQTKAEAEALAARIRREEKMKIWVVSLTESRSETR